MFKILENNLKDNNYDNQIYFCLTKEEIDNLTNLLKEDHGYFDIIIDFSDIGKLNNLVNDIPEHLNKDIIIKYIYQYYLYYKMLSVVEEDLGLKNVLFGNNINSFREYDVILFSTVLKKLQSISSNKKIRIHLFLDNVKDKLLQKQINDLIYMRIPIVIMGYITKEQLITYLTSSGSLIESPHDYMKFYTQEFYNKLKKKNLFE